MASKRHHTSQQSCRGFRRLNSYGSKDVNTASVTSIIHTRLEVSYEQSDQSVLLIKQLPMCNHVTQLF